MNKSGRPGRIILLSTIISALGYLIILAFAAYNLQPVAALAWRRPLVGSVLASICVFGLVLALKPPKCSETFGHKTKRRENSMPPASNSIVAIKGHHYDCSRFSAHIVRVRGHVLCAACTGLSIGAIGTLLATAVYFFVGLEFQGLGFIAVALGVAAMVSGFFQMKSKGFARLFLNILFVFGGFLILSGMDQLVGTLSIDLFTIALITFWIFTRILLSQWDHWKICRTCFVSCENRIKEKWS